MSTEEPNRERTNDREDGVPAGPASTPIDHPYFLPILLAAMTVWFGYDILFNPELMEEHGTFNYVGFAVLFPLTIWFSYKGWKEMQEIKASESESREAPSEPPDRA